MELTYRRVVLKISGEALAGNEGLGIRPEIVHEITAQIKEVHDLGLEIAIVIGGGNLWRGKMGSDLGMDRATSDYMGMLGTCMNGLALQDSLERNNVPTRMMTSIEMRQVAELYIRRKAVRHLEKGRVVIFSSGNGTPYFSTDTTAALRAAEIEAEAILMAKNNVDGIYSADPNLDTKAIKYETVTYKELLHKGLSVMDSTATSLSMDNNIPVIVFSLMEKGNILRVVKGEKIGTFVSRT